MNYRKYITDNNIKSGVIVIDIEKDSPASKAGLESGDIITEINGNSIKNIAYLRYELYKYDINDTIKVKVLRDSKEKEFSIKLSSNLAKS